MFPNSKVCLPGSNPRRSWYLGLCGLVGLLVTAPLPAPAAVLINELMADPASDWDGDGQYSYRDDEWVEVVNTGPTTVDLTQFWLRDGTGEDAHLNLFGSLAPGEVACFTGAQAVAWQIERGLAVEGLSLNNTGDSVVLLRTIPDTVGPELEPVDEAVYLDHEAEDDRSSGRDHLGEGWFLFDGLNLYGGSQLPTGTGCPPTFGLPNDCQTLPLESLSFGAVKAIYR